MTSTLNASRSVLANLLSHCDDNAADHVLWVGHDGQVHLDALSRGVTANSFAALNEPDIKFRLDTFQRGEGYVGSAASKDQIWVNRLFVALDRLWTNDTNGLVKTF
jgi:hypothetical protein